MSMVPPTLAEVREIRVLVVDDDPMIRRLLRRVLENARFSVRVAHGVDDGLECASEWRPHVVVTDVHLGRRDGRELAALVRGRLGGHTRMLFCTGEPEAVLESASPVLPKPFRIGQLIEAVRALAR